MKFPNKFQKSFDRYIKKEIRKNICRFDSNVIFSFGKKNNPSYHDLKKYHNSLSRVYSERSRLYFVFEDGDNYNRYFDLSIEEAKKSVNYVCNIWEEAFSR